MELQKGVKIKNKTKLLGKYKELALETAKQRLTALASRLRRYTKDAETKTINALFSKEPSKEHFQLHCNTTVRPEPPEAEDYMGRREDT